MPIRYLHLMTMSYVTAHMHQLADGLPVCALMVAVIDQGSLFEKYKVEESNGRDRMER